MAATMSNNLRQAGEWDWFDHTLMVMPVSVLRKPCRCCGNFINFGEEVFRFSRMRKVDEPPCTKILGEEIWLAPWYTCEECSDLISAAETSCIDWNWGKSIKYQIAHFRAEFTK